ncbi:MAG: CCA tRNA nucleotidyltransferase [Planctomycetes bacterium]|nr:CCA tRNA nucleotidyltransferase [Planctomycetota bacterium]
MVKKRKTNSSRRQPKTKKSVALSVIKRLTRSGYQAFFAGGCVRDQLRGKQPIDYDIATDARPNQVIKLFKKTIAVGKAFGVIKVLIGGFEFEITTFRSEGPYRDGRHPSKVTFTDLAHDVQRRDFTINGMAFDPFKRKVIDLVHGRQDLKKKIVRAIGDPLQRFREDKLRMLRAVRFATELNFTIEPKTKGAIKKTVRQISQVSAERIREELKKILLSPHRARGIKLLDDTGLLKRILPEVARMKGVKQPPQFHPEGDVYIHTLITLGHLKNPSWELALATLLHDVGKPPTFMITDRIRFHEHERVGSEMAEQICQRLKLSNAEKEKVMWLIDRHMVFKDAEKMRVSTLKRLFRAPHYQDLAELHRVDRLASDLDLAPHRFCARLYKKLSKEDLKPPPLINGHDLIKLGLKPGPVFSRILKKVESAQLEKEISTKRQALKLARSIVRKP